MVSREEQIDAFYQLAHQELHDLKDFDRHNYLGEPQASMLNMACSYINKALGDTCYLVGSATHAKAFVYNEADFGELIDLKNMIEHRLKEIDNDATASI